MAKKGILGEFRDFAVKGNVIDLAVGVVIGGAFGKITGSLVNDVLMPILGTLLGGVDFSKLNIELAPIFAEKEPIMLNLGTFVNTIVDFIVIAFAIFLFVKAINKYRSKHEEPAAPPEPPEASKEEMLLTEIRDILKEGK